MSREAMQQALEALERTDAEPGTLAWERENEAMEALRAALAEQAQPVAECIDDICSEHSGRVEAFDHLPAGTKLYTTPPAPVVPPGWKLVPAELTEAMLSAAQSAWLRDPARKTTTMYRAMLAAAPEAPSPPAPQPLADDDIHLITGHCGVSKHAAISIARAVEAEVLKRMGVQR